MILVYDNRQKSGFLIYCMGEAQLTSDLEGTEMKKRRYVLLTAALLLGLAACGGEK
ncbi:hypothetical protein [uncultured Intestinimonas sp.]|uniref:hypothetical protein n=1 Tax=uncultured Intestinimonas sp. TaxID=1689265 RepID=UPI0025EA8751|nr:hypothetical protein [uncultured Intestinimonas sp.]